MWRECIVADQEIRKVYRKDTCRKSTSYLPWTQQAQHLKRTRCYAKQDRSTILKCKAQGLELVSHRLAVRCSRRSRSWSVLHPKEVIAIIECAYKEGEPTAGVMNYMFFFSTEKVTPKAHKKYMAWYWDSETWSRKKVPRHTTIKNSSRWCKAHISK